MIETDEVEDCGVVATAAPMFLLYAKAGLLPSHRSRRLVFARDGVGDSAGELGAGPCPGGLEHVLLGVARDGPASGAAGELHANLCAQVRAAHAEVDDRGESRYCKNDSCDRGLAHSAPCRKKLPMRRNFS